ncbi:MAG: T9SS type A sorting domain-containing protein [FCB group bacterium]|nr:T9SS type A sorting domain-containing protein [FCB group bacterium]
MRKLAALTAILSIFVLSSMALAVPDPGEPDTVFVESKVLPLGTTEFTLDIGFYNDEDLQAFDIGLIWDSPDISCDSVSFFYSRVAYVNFKLFEIDNAAQRMHGGPVVMFESLIPPGRGQGYLAYFSIDPAATAQVITFDSSKYPPAGDFVFTLGSGFNIVPQFVGGTVTLGEPSPPSISLSPANIEVSGYTGSSLPTDQIDITNAGSGALNWSATASSGWLSVNPASGTGNGTIDVDYNLTGLAAGTYYDTVWVSDPGADNSPQSVAVMLTLVDPPCLAVSTDVINFDGFEGETLNEILNISNCGGAPLEWTISGIDAFWLSVSHSSGTNDLAVTFIVNTTMMFPGDYSDVVTISGTDADNSPQDITINLTVNELIVIENDTVKVATVSAAAGDQAVVEVSYENFSPTSGFQLPLHFAGTGLLCDSVSFAGSRFEYMSINDVTIDNDAFMVLIGATILGEDPLAAGSGLMATMYFAIDPSAADQFISIDSGLYPPIGEYMFYDTTGASKPTEFFSGGINISGVPCFEFPTTEIVFNGMAGSPIPSVSLEPTNSCGGTLTWTLADDAPWLTVTPSGTEGDDAVFAVSTTVLAPGSYTATASFVSNGLDAPFEVTVIMNLAGNPVLGLSTTEVELGSVCLGESVSGTFGVSNLGTGDLNWAVSSTDPITFVADNGAAPSTVEFSAATTGLAYGPQTMEITVTSEDASNSPLMVEVSFNVINCTDCTFDIADVEAPQGYSVPVPIYAFDVSDVVGFEFHIECEDDFTTLSLDSITSDYIVTDILWQKLVTLVHIVWVGIDYPTTVPDGEPIITLWMTNSNDIGHVSQLDWHEGNEVVGLDGNPMLGLGYCNGSMTVISPTFDVAGGITYYDPTLRPIPDVTVDLSGDAATTTYTNVDGDYLFADLLAGLYTITPSRSADDSGTSIADAIMIQRHLAFLEPFDTPYEMIAADVNLSNTVSVADAVLVEMYLAMLMDLPSGNWIFVDQSYGLTMGNWFTAPQSMDIVVTNADIVLPNFVGIRMGDVNYSWSPTPLALKANSADGVIALDVEDVSGISGELITVPITISSAVEIAGLELHLGYDQQHLTAIDIKSDLLTNFRSNPAADAVHLVWENFASPIEVTDKQTLATITFRADEWFDVVTEIHVSGAEVANSKGDVYTLDLSGGTIIANANSNPTLPTAYSLEQNTPNPFNPRTTIRATMKEAGNYTLTIINITGETIRTYRGSADAGNIELDWDGRSDNGEQAASGVYFYRFDAGDFIDTRKMMLLK